MKNPKEMREPRRHENTKKKRDETGKNPKRRGTTEASVAGTEVSC